MIIKQKRINSTKHFEHIEEGMSIKLGIRNIEHRKDCLRKMGFDENPQIGSKILPIVFNTPSFKNAEIYTTIDRSVPKEDYIQTVYWTRKIWAGRGQTREVSDFTCIPRKRYKRIFHSPFSIEFTIEKEESINLYSDEIVFNEENANIIINTVNLILSVFGECEIFSDNAKFTSKVIRLTWDILPQGKYPWKKLSSIIADVSKKRNNTERKMMIRNCTEIYNQNPDFTAVGRSGFSGYIVFGFTAKHLYILESVYPNNATYIFENDWESFSQLTKAEVLSENLQKCRIIHTENWRKNLINLLDI